MEYVYVAKNVVPLDLCEKIIEKFDRDPNKCKGKLAYDTINYNLKKTIDLQYDHENDPEWKSIHDKVDMCLQTAFNEYTKYLYENTLPGLVISDIMHREIVRTGFQIQKYNIGDYFDWHVDDLKENRRLMSYIIYFNTLKKEDGGYTEFFNSKKIQPVAGNILFFPATWTYPHRGAPLKDKVKYIATGFIQEV